MITAALLGVTAFVFTYVRSRVNSWQRGPLPPLLLKKSWMSVALIAFCVFTFAVTFQQETWGSALLSLGTGMFATWELARLHAFKRMLRDIEYYANGRPIPSVGVAWQDTEDDDPDHGSLV